MHDSKSIATSTAKPIAVYTTGGTIDKIYFDALSEFAIGDSMIGAFLEQANVGVEYSITELMKKDSLEITADDREIISSAVCASQSERIIITHGTDTMPATADILREATSAQCVVLCGSMQPARMRDSDAAFNIGAALIAVQTLPHGVYIVMGGQVFEAGQVKKNRQQGRFEEI